MRNSNYTHKNPKSGWLTLQLGKSKETEMGKRKLSNEKLYEVVQQVSKDTKPQEIESLLLQVCTRIKNHEPLTQAMIVDGYPAWDHALLEIFRNLRRPTRFRVMPSTQLKSSTKAQTIQWSVNYISVLRTHLASIVENFSPGNLNNSGLNEDKSYIDARFEMPGYPRQLASIGFSKKDGAFYWCIGNLPDHKQPLFLTAGYYLWKREIYKDFDLPNNFFDLNSARQEKWFVSYISELVQEFDKLYQPS